MLTVHNKPIQRQLIPVPVGERQLLEPGWAGELAVDELEYLQNQLRDKKLAFTWGFRPGAKRRREWAIRQVAMFGVPDSRRTNIALARHQIPINIESNRRIQSTTKEYFPGINPPGSAWEIVGAKS